MGYNKHQAEKLAHEARASVCHCAANNQPGGTNNEALCEAKTTTGQFLDRAGCLAAAGGGDGNNHFTPTGLCNWNCPGDNDPKNHGPAPGGEQQQQGQGSPAPANPPGLAPIGTNGPVSPPPTTA